MYRSVSELGLSFELDVRDNRERMKRWRKKRDKPRLSIKKNVVCSILTQIKGMLQKLRYKVVRGEVRVFPVWMDVKSHIVEMIWRKSQSDLQMGVLRAWGHLGITNVTSVCWARWKWAGWWLPRAWPHGAGGWRKAQQKSSLQIQPRAERPRKKGRGGWTCVLN